MDRLEILATTYRVISHSTWWQFARMDHDDNEQNEIIKSIVGFIVKYLCDDDHDSISFEKKIFNIGDKLCVDTFFGGGLDSRLHEMMICCISRLKSGFNDAHIINDCTLCIAVLLKYCDEYEHYFNIETLELIIQADKNLLEKILLDSFKLKNYSLNH
jgi:hypothetical protein